MPTAWSAASGTIGTISVSAAPNEHGRPGGPGMFVMVTLNSRLAYQNFLALWKDADPDIPVLRDARAEYQKVQ